MATRRVHSQEDQPKRRRPSRTPEGRERQMITAAIDLAERQLMDGTASSQVTTHYLRLASSREKLEQELLTERIDLERIKRETLESAQRSEALYSEALSAFRSYTGEPEPEQDFGDDEYYDA